MNNKQQYIFYLKNGTKIVLTDTNVNFEKNKDIKNILSKALVNNKVSKFETDLDLLLLKSPELIGIQVTKLFDKKNLDYKKDFDYKDVNTKDNEDDVIIEDDSNPLFENNILDNKFFNNIDSSDDDLKEEFNDLEIDFSTSNSVEIIEDTTTNNISDINIDEEDLNEQSMLDFNLDTSSNSIEDNESPSNDN